MSQVRANDVLRLIGGTPMVRLNRIAPVGAAGVWLKLEGCNIGGSVKDRAALNMIERAEETGLIHPGETTLIEATSGNTGIGLALIAAVKGYRLVVIMGEAVSVERRRILEAYGAELIITPKSPRGLEADLELLDELVKEHGYFPVRQFENPYNPEIHYNTTGPEIEETLGAAPDVLVAGVGTGGTITGAGRYLRGRKPDIRIIAVEPDASPVLSGGERAPHAIQGIGSGVIPTILDTEIYDAVARVTETEATEMSRALAKEEGLLAGYSGGAAVWAAVREAKRIGRGKTVAVIVPDTGERYLSTPLFGAGKEDAEERFETDSLEIVRVTEEWQRAGVHYVRTQGMVREYGKVTLSGEFSEDTSGTEYILALDGRIPVGTCRLHMLGGDAAKIERVCVIPEYRGKNVGRAVIRAAEQWLAEKGISHVIIASKEDVTGFYAALGYDVHEDETTDDGIFRSIYTYKDI
jgi:cysteine synthase A